MKKLILASVIALLSLNTLVATSKAENVDTVKQLLKTNQCQGCDLREAQFGRSPSYWGRLERC
ncbi:MAG: hypothetical protein RML10_01370 [Geminocystis sp.]|nr:hypothetical protein [Geminocystis sp.]